MSNRVLPVRVPPAECGWEEGDGLFTIRDVLHDGVHLGLGVEKADNHPGSSSE